MTTNNVSDKNYGHSQLGYFLDFETWNDALKLLNFQIKQRPDNKHYNTLSIFYYEKASKECINTEDYFFTKIASSLFYGLKKEFAVYHHVIPKKGLGLRDYTFFTYPARALYYSVGLYILKLSQEFLSEVHKKLKNVHAFYGGNLYFEKDILSVNKSNTYYRQYYDEFTSLIRDETDKDKDNKVIIKLDIENCFGEISIALLLEKLNSIVKSSVKSNLNFDVFTKEQICTFFEFITYKKTGIPQAENNIISGFIGHLFMSIGDLMLDDLLNTYHDIIQDYKIIRYVDDINIVIIFRENVAFKRQGESTLYIASEIAEVFYRELNLRLNLKTRAYHLKEIKDEEELLARNKTLISQDNAGFDYDEYHKDNGSENDESTDDKDFLQYHNPQQKLDKILQELEKLKASNIEDYFMRSNVSLSSEGVFRDVFNRSVLQIICKEKNIKKLRRIFEDFNFDLIKVKPFELIILITQNQILKKKFRDFLIQKKSITTSDIDLIIKYLCQDNFSDEDLFKKLAENILFKDIVELIINPSQTCEMPGYHNLSCMSIRRISYMPEVIEQMRMRYFYERNQSYSVALNHLLNEIHAVCIRAVDDEDGDCNANKVFEYLTSINIPYETRITIRNLFDRRNHNGVSHPGKGDNAVWEVTKEEYFDYQKHVGYCLGSLLFSPKINTLVSK